MKFDAGDCVCLENACIFHARRTRRGDETVRISVRPTGKNASSVTQWVQLRTRLRFHRCATSKRRLRVVRKSQGCCAAVASQLRRVAVVTATLSAAAEYGIVSLLVGVMCVWGWEGAGDGGRFKAMNDEQSRIGRRH